MPPLGRLVDIKQIVMPRKGEHVFIAPSANVIGDVKLGSKSSIWYGAVLRGEIMQSACMNWTPSDVVRLNRGRHWY